MALYLVTWLVKVKSAILEHFIALTLNTHKTRLTMDGPCLTTRSQKQSTLWLGDVVQRRGGVYRGRHDVGIEDDTTTIHGWTRMYRG